MYLCCRKDAVVRGGGCGARWACGLLIDVGCHHLANGDVMLNNEKYLCRKCLRGYVSAGSGIPLSVMGQNSVKRQGEGLVLMVCASTLPSAPCRISVL